MTAPLVRELAEDGYPVAVTCEVLEIPRSSYYEAATRPLSARAVADAELTATIAAVHADSRGTYGAPRVHAELRLGLGISCGRKRVARLMRDAGLQGVCHRRKRGQRPAPATHEDLVKRVFTADAPDRVWFTDITQHRAADGWVYCCAVIDAYTRAAAFGAQVEKPPRTTWKGTPLHELWLKDPDGNLMEIYARLTDAELAAKPVDEMPEYLVPGTAPKS